ncbi:hypothetical protein AVEN_109360-1 [Araneus ventricosus]|uniref:Uncharacterized protein n=1 Tax=Araneus ventricosus TaxID=182803 RepID=A0A4Y2S6N2_ARAVE|nr:hypothetical protein AVEN_109360-1 [Araneus ventricosus]
MLALWLGRDFHRGIYGNAGEMENSTPDLGDKMRDLESNGIFLIPLLGTEIRIDPDDSMWRHGLFGGTIKGLSSDHREEWCVDRLESSLECERLRNLSLEIYPQCELESC